MLETILTDLGITGTASHIYVRLLESGASSARQLAENLNVPRPSIYDNLKILINRGLVVERDEDNKKLFQVDDVKYLPQLMHEKIKQLQKNEQVLTSLLPSLIKQDTAIEPRIKFFHGLEGARHAIRDFLWYPNAETMTLWPISDIIDFLGADFMADLNRRRLRNHISIRAVWARDKAVSMKEYPFMGVGGDFLREIREAPVGMSWSMGAWLYADKVAFISSKEESFGFIIRSRDFFQLMKAQFDMIWPVSKPLKAQPQYTDAFLKTV